MNHPHKCLNAPIQVLGVLMTSHADYYWLLVPSCEVCAAGTEEWGPIVIELERMRWRPFVIRVDQMTVACMLSARKFVG